MSLQFPFFGSLSSTNELLQNLEDGNFRQVLSCTQAKSLLGTNNENNITDCQEWRSNLEKVIKDGIVGKESLLLVGYAALQAFLQSNVTGPPLEWAPSKVCLPSSLSQDISVLRNVQTQLNSELAVDGEALYTLTPHVELFYIAKIILNYVCQKPDALRWARVRVNFWHQRLLSEIAVSLQDLIYTDLAYLEGILLGNDSVYTTDTKAAFLLERAAIHIYHGFEKKARDDLDDAARLRGFEYVLTGRLGKRTKYQQFDITQLVLLAKSQDETDTQKEIMNPPEDVQNTHKEKTHSGKPRIIDLNDDTLLESISFSESKADNKGNDGDIPPSLAVLDPAKQPLLNTLDSILLLLYASSITNTSPDDGLTREETLPYAIRVLDGGSSNWQVYTQALLVRSRIEGYRSRTVERGVLQLQALVDQVIAETIEGHREESSDLKATQEAEQFTPTFLPRAKPSESASARDRLVFVNQLASPPRWSLEAELAARWVTLGGLRTALEIYERLEMCAEAALCWAATEREDKALRIVRSQLYHCGKKVEMGASKDDLEQEDQFYGAEKAPLPADAPRLFCILGDLEKSAVHYERAWEISKHRYTRAQTSLGKHYLSVGDLIGSEEAYSKSLKVNPQNAATWFTLGCVRLKLKNWRGAVNAFSRAVSSDPEDGEAWSNLAAALLRLPPDEAAQGVTLEGDDQLAQGSKLDAQRHVREAFIAFKRAAALKQESYRIWQNVLNVAAILSPPPYADLIVAQERLIDLRSETEGESCVDIEIMEGLLAHIVATTPTHTGSSASDETEFNPKDEDQRPQRHWLERAFVKLFTKRIVPLITTSRRLWQMSAKLSLHLNKPSSALDAYEKAWRLMLNQPGWDDGTGGGSSNNVSSSPEIETPEKAWTHVVDATIELADAYESLGEREVTEGLKAGSGELVCKNWRYKARTAVRSVIGRREKAGLEGTEALNDKLKELK